MCPTSRNTPCKGYDLVIAVGFLEEQALGQVAKKFPNTKFAIVYDSTSVKALKGLKNVEGLLYKEGESGYLAGYLAGLFEKSRCQGPQLGERRCRPSAASPSRRSTTTSRASRPAPRPRIRRQAAQRLFGRLHRPGQVPGPRAAADRTGLGHRLPGRRPVRPRRINAARDKGLWAIGVDTDQSLQVAQSSCSSPPPRASTCPWSTSSGRS